MSKKIIFCIQALQSDAATPIPNAEIQIENINLGQKMVTDSNGMAYFEIEDTQKLKSFRAKLIHKDYNEIPISDRSIIINALKNKTQILRFNKKIWILFNGKHLRIMQDRDTIIKEFSVSSKIDMLKLANKNKGHFEYNFFTQAKDFTTKELETKINEKPNNKSIIDFTHKKLSSQQETHINLQHDNFQNSNSVLENGEYYIDPNVLETFYNECKYINSLKNNVRYKALDDNDKEDSINNDTPSLTLYKDKECKEEYAKIILSDNNMKTHTNQQKNIIIEAYQAERFAYYINKQVKQSNQEELKINSDTTANQVEEILIYKQDSNIENERVIVNINKPFAPGTYIQLESRGKNLEANQDIYWKTELRMLNGDKILNFQEHYKGKNIKTFYLTLLYEIDYYKQQGYSNFQYIIYASSINQFNENTPHLIFNINFEVGDLLNSHVIESTTQDSDTTNKIYTLSQAVEYLRMNYDKLQKEYGVCPTYKDVYNFFKRYPRIAGKIAYIYYRFDLADDEFIKSVVQDNGEYLQDREKYINNIKSIFTTKKLTEKSTTAILDEYIYLINTNDKIKNRYFANQLTRLLCKELALPLYNFKTRRNEIDIYADNESINGYYYENLIYINEKILSDLKRTIKTIIHEVRHFYIDKYYKQSDKLLKAYVYFSRKFYILDDDLFIFSAFCKRCDIADSDNVGCTIVKTQDAYEIQPNERDQRYVAMQIINILP